MKLLNYSMSYLVETNTPQPPKRPYINCQLRILCRVIRQRKITREYFYNLISEVYQCQSIHQLSYEEMYRVIWVLNHWKSESNCFLSRDRV